MLNKQAEREDVNLLSDMVDAETLEPLLKAFGTVFEVGAGIFKPDGLRIGRPAHHSPYCKLVASTRKGREGCRCCDDAHRKKVIRERAGATSPYFCHANLIDFCEPIYRGGKRRGPIIGLFFAGQVRRAEDEISQATIRRIFFIAKKYGIRNKHELLARYISIPQCSKRRIKEIRSLMRQLANFIGLLVDKKASTQSLLLDVIRSGDDQNAILQAVRKNLLPASVSLFLCAGHGNGSGRIQLVATTYPPLARRLYANPGDPELSYAPNEGLTGWVFGTQKSVLIEDLKKKSTWPKLIPHPKWSHKVVEIPRVSQSKSFMAVPIRSVSGEVIGVMRAVRTRSQPIFTSDDLKLLTGITSHVSAAVSKVNIVKKYLEGVYSLLDSLANPAWSLPELADRMAAMLGEAHVENGPWEAVYVLQHVQALNQFCIFGVYPSNVKTGDHMDKGFEFSEKKGVAGHLLRTRKAFAHANLVKSKVVPAKPWNSVAAAPIIHRDEFWGVVALCGHSVSPNEVYDAKVVVSRFADQMATICHLSDLLNVHADASTMLSKLISWTTAVHDMSYDLHCALITIDRLREDLSGRAALTAKELSSLLHDTNDWVAVYRDLGHYMKLCRREPRTAISKFWAGRYCQSNRQKKTYIYKIFNTITIVNKIKASVRTLEKRYKIKVKWEIVMQSRIRGDPNLVLHALRNIVENAFIWGSKSADIRKGPCRDINIIFRVRKNQKDNGTIFEIEDSGHGINAEELILMRQMFNNPTNLHNLALASGFGTMVTAFVAAVHKAKVSIESELDNGTIIRFTFPSVDIDRRN